MAKDPAFLFYSDNFQSGVQFFSDEQVGKYMRLLCAQHLHGHLTEKNMMHICKSYDIEIWAKFKKDSEGLYYNERLENEVFKRRKYSDSRSKNRKSTHKDTEPKKKISKSYDKHMEDGNGIGDEIENTNAIENFIVPEMQSIFKKYNSKYIKNRERDFKPLLSIAKFLAENGSLNGTIDENKGAILAAWDPLCSVISKDKFYSSKTLSVISNQIQEITQIALHGKTNGKPDYGSKERAKEFDRMFAERYPNG